MRRTKGVNIVLTFLVLVTTSYLTLTFLPIGGRATTHYVGGTGPGNFTTIQDAINLSNPGDTIYVYNGTYYENVDVNKTLNLIGEGKNITIIDGGGNRDVINITADWVNITGFTVANSGSDINDSGIRLHYAHNCTIVGSNVSDNWNGIYLHNSNQNAILDNTVLNNIQGIFLKLSDNSTVASNIVKRGGILVFYSDNASITNNTVSLSDIAILLDYSNETTVSNNKISNNLYGIMTDSSDDTTIEGNIIETISWDGIRFEFSSNGVIRNNTISNGSVGIRLNNKADNNTIVGNTISSNQLSAVSVFSSNNTLIGNKMIENGIVIGGTSVELWNSHTIDTTNSVNGKPVYYWKNVIGGSIPSDAGQIILANCSNVVVERQKISGASVGIALSFSSNNTVFNNTVSNNSLAGIYVVLSDDNIVADNDIMSNGFYGLYLESSGGNVVFHNSFINNTGQAYDDTGNNRWYDWYPSGGNYWSDYTGPDQFSGPDQNEPGSDGIGDWEHPIDGGNAWDKYPMLSPFDLAHPLPPTILKASLSGRNLENVTINWSLSLDDEMGLKSVVGYEIYRNASYNRDGLNYQLIASPPNGTSEFVDVSSGEGDPNNYFYRVCAKDLNNNTRCAMNQAAKFTRSLSEGPNLVSTPLIQSNESIEVVLQTLRWDKAWTYNSSIKEWKWHMNFKPYLGQLDSLARNEGLWVNVIAQSNLTVTGIVPEATDIHLYPGWNLVGFPSFNSTYTVGDLKTETNATRVEGYIPLISPYFLQALSDGDILQTGFGYWINVESEVVWTAEV
ncbi:MAG: right-handed parallel beta-helix repeat-containing protein [Thermoplasmata archaeon]|nr:right-handed parallel beta-helix repeat-containing protein [Thermoplasmata archaeon]